MQVTEQQLLDDVILPALDSLHEHNPVAPMLLCDMAQQASGLDPLCRRNGGIGLYQITSAQHRRVWDEYVAPDPDLASRLRGLASQRQFLRDPDSELQFNLIYATAIAWLYRCMLTACTHNAVTAPNPQSARVPVSH